jgi:hypothetical protein
MARTDVPLLEAFKEKHKADLVYARLAEARIEKVKREDENKAEAERQAMLRQQQEVARRKQVEASEKAEAERKRVALLQYQEEVRKRAEELKQHQVPVSTPKLEKPQGLTSFDGTWTITQNSSSPFCRDRASHST